MKNGIYIELTESLSWSVDNDNYMLTAMFSSSEGDTIIDFPLHEDFLDFALAYVEQYKRHINNKINNEL
jgi:hypothetical protein